MLGDFKNFIDMINGGGAGRAGQRFEGGGLLSMIANAVARPYGFEERMGQVRPQMRPARPMPAPMPTSTPTARPAVSPLEMFGGQPPAPYSPPQRSPLEMFGGQQPAPYSPMTEEERMSQFLRAMQNASPQQQAEMYRMLIAPPPMGGM